MNSLELTRQLRRISLESGGGSVPAPPPSLPPVGTAADSEQLFDFDMDCSGFNAVTPSSSRASSAACSYGSLSSASKGGELTRSRCVHRDLSALGGPTPADWGVPRLVSRGPSSERDGCWGYFADTPSS